MDGPSHYRKAEELISESIGTIPERSTHLIQRAQVHATLALAGEPTNPQRTNDVSQLLRYQRDAAVTEINTLRSAVQEQLNDLVELRAAVRKMLAAAVVQDDGVWVRPTEFYAVTDLVAEDGAP